MVTISRTNRVFTGLRPRIAIISILFISLAFGAVALFTVAIVEDFLVSQRLSDQQRIVDELSIAAAPKLAEHDTETLYSYITESGKENNSRILLLNRHNIVLMDSNSLLNGTKIDLPEIDAVSSGSVYSSYAFHRLPQGESGDQWFVYYTSSIVNDADRIGTILFSVSAQDISDALTNIRFRLLLFMGLTMIIVLVLSLVAASLIINPITKMTGVVEKMGRGDFKQRIKVRGKAGSELWRLANNFNQMSERLEQLDQSRNAFVSNASHELRTPLASIKLIVQSLMQQEGLPQEMYNEFLGDIDKEIDRLNAIISDLLTMVQMDQQDNAKHEQVDLRGLLLLTVRSLAPMASAKNIQVETDLNEAYVEGDTAKLRQMFSNLVDNAIKYTPDGGSIKVSCGRTGQTATVSVSDTGIGIPEDAIPHIFDRFYRVDKARSRTTGGTGLGLSIVKQIAELHKGTINVASEEGKGSTFTVEMPALLHVLPQNS